MREGEKIITRSAEKRGRGGEATCVLGTLSASSLVVCGRKGFDDEEDEAKTSKMRTMRFAARKKTIL